MSWGRFFFEIYISKPKGNTYEDLASFSMHNQDDVKTHRDKVAEYLKELDKAIAENAPDDLEIVMNS